MRSTLTLSTTFESNGTDPGIIRTVLELDGDQITKEVGIAMHADALATIAQMQARLCGIKTDQETLDMDGHRVY